MKNKLVTAIIAASAAIVLFVFVGCQSVTSVGIAKYTDFTPLPFPSNAFKPSQVVEVYSSPRKVEITHDPEIPWDKVTPSDGWNISASDTNSLSGQLSANVQKVLGANFEYLRQSVVKVSFTNTKSYIVPKELIFVAIEKNLAKGTDLRRIIDLYKKNGTHFDVVTTTLSANVTFEILDASKNAIKVDTEVLEKLNTELGFNLATSSSANRLISADNLVVGFHYDPKMINNILSIKT